VARPADRSGAETFVGRFISHTLTPLALSPKMRAPSARSARGIPQDLPRHMDVYPSRNVDIREHRVPASHYKLIVCGDRLRSAGVFLD
jgi:hypothetical protein